jgi:hypothetical protein
MINGFFIVSQIFHAPPKSVHRLFQWYGHADLPHDFAVQSPDAFDATIDGLLTGKPCAGSTMAADAIAFGISYTLSPRADLVQGR